VESTVKAGLEWLDANKEADKATVEGKQKEWEEVIRPILMKAYAGTAGKTDPAAPAPGPTVEEVD
jgi:hypothetical protein